MKTLEQFKRANRYWLENTISGYVNEMEWDEGMNSHPGDYFTDTLYVARKKCEDEELALEIKSYIESEVISKLAKV